MPGTSNTRVLTLRDAQRISETWLSEFARLAAFLRFAGANDLQAALGIFKYDTIGYRNPDLAEDFHSTRDPFEVITYFTQNGAIEIRVDTHEGRKFFLSTLEAFGNATLGQSKRRARGIWMGPGGIEDKDRRREPHR